MAKAQNSKKTAPGIPFAKGKSGNPGGRPKESAEVKALARSHTPMCMNTLAEIAEKGKKQRDRIAAANALLDRGWGKPSQAIEHSGLDGGPIGIAVRFVNAE